MIETNAIEEVLSVAAALTQREGRSAAARLLAGRVGADDLIMFVRDPSVGQSLPAPGFRQTLHGGRTWRALVEKAIVGQSAEAQVMLDEGDLHHAHAIGSEDGTVAVFLDGQPRQDRVQVVRSLLPFLGAIFRMEAITLRAEGDLVVARQSAKAASELAAKLDAARADLQGAVSLAETATRARDEFLATVSHELRTPLTSIIGWVQLLRHETDPKLVREGLDTLDRNARSQSRLIEDILDFSRINAGKLRLEIRAVDLADVIDAALEVVRPAADARGVRLETMLGSGAGLVSGDADRLQQAVWNLLSNAVKFTSRGGRVLVRLQRVNSHCEIAVSDTGQGIQPSFLPFVFDRFSQADSTTTRSHGGLGLGLGIVRHLVELHGGSVEAFSAGAGEGATFVIKLPMMATQRLVDTVQDGASERVPPPATSERFADLGGVTVLVVEDNEDARKMLAAILRRSGATVETAPDVAAAMHLLGYRRPDLIVSDIEMPVEDGYSFIRKVRLQEKSKHVPAIALTASAMSVDRLRALAAGFQMHMAKPVEPTELVAAVKSLLTTRGG